MILYVFMSGGTKLICAMTSEMDCFSAPRKTLYSRVTSYGRDCAGSRCRMSCMRCRIRFRSGISSVDEVTCDDEARVANRTKPESQRIGVAVLVRLKRTVRRKASSQREEP